MTDGSGAGLADRADVDWKRRLLVFGGSIRSDFGNPQATTWRALMRSLSRAGHEVVYIEPRRSEPLTSLLRHRGSAPLRQFAGQFPDLQYRTLDLPRGRELAIWLARELALIDAVVVLDDASPELRALIDDYAEPGLVRFTTDRRDDDSHPSTATSVRLAPVGETTPESADDVLRIGPAITMPNAVQPPTSGQQRLVVLAWDTASADLAEQTRQVVRAHLADAVHYSLGTLALPGWTPVTSLDMETVLAGIDLAVVVSDPAQERPDAIARSLLAWASGVRTLTVVDPAANQPAGVPGTTVTIDQLAERLADSTPPPDPELASYAADAQAARLIAAIDHARAADRLRS